MTSDVDLLLGIIREKAEHCNKVWDGKSYDVLMDVIREFGARKSKQCKCTGFDGAVNKPYYECVCGHHWDRHVKGEVRCEGVRAADKDEKPRRLLPYMKGRDE